LIIHHKKGASIFSLLQKFFMHKQLQKALLISITFFAFAFLIFSCKKQDKYPAQTLPNIITVNPTSAIPGAPVDIKGTNLKAVTAIRFGTVDAVFQTPSDTSISAIVPDSLPPGDLYVQVYIGDGVAYAAQKFTILEAPKIPTIASVSPETAFPEDQITIKGINFSAVSSVTFGSTVALFTIDDSAKLTVTIPDGLSDANQIITVSAPTGSDTISYTVNLAPVIKSIDPSSAHEGDLITVKGIRFTGATSLQLGSTNVTFDLQNDSLITFTVPAGASSGNVTVTTANGSGTSSASLSVLTAGLAVPFYDDAINWPTLTGGWIGGGWGGSKDPDNTDPVESGTKSCKISYDAGAYGSPLQLGGANFSLAPYKEFKISIYGGPGSAGKKFGIVFNSGDEYFLNLGAEGQWNDYAIPLNSFSSTANLTDLWIKDESGTSYYIYVDNMGLN
jgi:IPT/TIG domain-containing protein